jgi:HTH-type transcriptional regulator/antitoxin HipB
MLITSPRELGQLVRDRRKQLGISQAQLAEMVGASRHWVIALERGNAGAELGLVLAALSAVGLRIDARRPGATDAETAAGRAVTEVIDRTRTGDSPPRRLRALTPRQP